MSDPVTNVEIEDVLSSIRRLVSDGDKARTRDPAPAEPTAAAAHSEPEPSRESSDTAEAFDRLVLTPALMVVDNGRGDPAVDVETADQQGGQPDHAAANDDDWQEEDWPEQATEHAAPQADADTNADTHADAVTEPNDDTTADLPADEPFPLTEMVFEDIDDDGIDDKEEPSSTTEAATPTDRAGLVATIAELEAAISAGDDDFEPDGSEVMGETIQWPGSVARNTASVPEAEISQDAASVETAGQEHTQTGEEDITAEFEHRPVSDVRPRADTVAQPVDDVAASSGASSTDAALNDGDTNRDETIADDAHVDPSQDINSDQYNDDDLDGLLDVASAGMDQDALRALVSEVVREELTGPLGERITRNVRKLVRREIYRILSSQEFD